MKMLKFMLVALVLGAMLGFFSTFNLAKAQSGGVNYLIGTEIAQPCVYEEVDPSTGEIVLVTGEKSYCTAGEDLCIAHSCSEVF